MTIKQFNRWLLSASALVILTACGGGNDNNPDSTDNQLRKLISENEFTGDPSIGRDVTNINDPLAQLGKKLFFSKSLSAEFESGCVTCHHPSLGFGDDLSLPIGTKAQNDDLLGPGRFHENGLLTHPRNAPTTINVVMWDKALFWDGRMESLGKTPKKHGNDGFGIRTPETVHGNADSNAAIDLSATFPGFPVTEPDEMAGFNFETDKPQGPVRNAAVREHLAGRLGNYGVGTGELASNDWLSEFRSGFSDNGNAEELITFDNIRTAIGAYMRSQVFVNSPWQNYLFGDVNALSESAKRGAVKFFTTRQDGGFECSSCHSGDFFTNESFYVLAMPQIGPGKGDGDGSDDLGRARETQDFSQSYKFRVPTLLNVEVTEPYGHIGSYQSLADVVRHHLNPTASIEDYFTNNRWCDLPQLVTLQNCGSMFPSAESNTRAALAQLQQNRIDHVPRVLRDVVFTAADVDDVVEFLRALTDPCLKDRECLLPWIADTNSNGPDEQQLNAIDSNGNLL